MKTINLFRINVEEEHRTIGYATTEKVAKEIAKGHGFWGGDAGVYNESFNVYESLEDYENEKDQEAQKARMIAKQKALNKLTSEERGLLGV